MFHFFFLALNNALVLEGEMPQKEGGREPNKNQQESVALFCLSGVSLMKIRILFNNPCSNGFHCDVIHILAPRSIDDAAMALQFTNLLVIGSHP